MADTVSNVDQLAPSIQQFESKEDLLDTQSAPGSSETNAIKDNPTNPADIIISSIHSNKQDKSENTATQTDVKPVNKDNNEQIKFDREPMNIDCPHCKKNVTTKIKYQINDDYFRIGCKVLLVGALVPGLVKKLKNVKHICPECHRLIGINNVSEKTSKHIGTIENEGEKIGNGVSRVWTTADNILKIVDNVTDN